MKVLDLVGEDQSTKHLTFIFLRQLFLLNKLKRKSHAHVPIIFVCFLPISENCLYSSRGVRSLIGA